MSPDEFDRTDPVDIELTAPAGTTITSVKLGDDTVDAANYTLAQGGRVAVLKKEWLETLSDGEKTFKAMADATACVTGTVTISGELAADFDRSDPEDIEIDVSDATITGVKLGDDAVDSSNITIASGSHAVTIKKEYLTTLSNGDKEFTVMASTTECIVCVVTVSGEGSASFSKADPADITIAVADADITGLKNGDEDVADTAYSIAEGLHSITITDDYLATLDNGDVTFSVVLDEADPVVYVVTVGD